MPLGESPLGHTAAILRGVWEPVKSLGALRVWWHCHAACWIGVALWLLTYYGWRWLLLPLLGWLMGHLALIKLTDWDDHFDDVFGAWLRGRYKDHYDV